MCCLSVSLLRPGDWFACGIFDVDLNVLLPPPSVDALYDCCLSNTFELACFRLTWIFGSYSMLLLDSTDYLKRLPLLLLLLCAWDSSPILKGFKPFDPPVTEYLFLRVIPYLSCFSLSSPLSKCCLCYKFLTATIGESATWSPLVGDSSLDSRVDGRTELSDSIIRFIYLCWLLRVREWLINGGSGS
jgi:hypothetical protein